MTKHERRRCVTKLERVIPRDCACFTRDQRGVWKRNGTAGRLGKDLGICRFANLPLEISPLDAYPKKEQDVLIFQMRKATTLLLLLLTIANWNVIVAEQSIPPLLYPFSKDGKWGYIDSTGAWVIEPRFERCIEIFETDRVKVWQKDRWGYIDRSGKWLTELVFNQFTLGQGAGQNEIVWIGKKQGILNPSGTLILPVKYDDIVLFEDRAWVRSGDKLGLFALDGHWIFKPSLHWPRKRDMPIPTNGGVSWFTRKNKWGLLSKEGKILFAPEFAEHEMGRRESEAWNHPEGLDFKNGRAWVVVGSKYQLITDDGRVLFTQALQGVANWGESLYKLTDNNYLQSLISRDGEIQLTAQFSEIRAPSEGRAVVVKRVERKKPDGDTDTDWSYGYIDEQGKIIVAPGTYLGPAGQLVPFSEGLAPVWNQSPEGARSSVYDPCAGYIDKQGTLVIAEQFRSTRSFSEGLGEVGQSTPAPPATIFSKYLWGYVDHGGHLIIPPQFGATTPFCNDRAWVLQAGARWDEPKWAMIDRTGKVLTDYAYEPPQGRAGWLYEGPDKLAKTRWRGNLAVLTRGDFRNGLATAEGKILVEPIFNRIGEFRDGIAVAVDTRQKDEKGNLKFVTALITEKGGILANDTYTAIGDFERGSAWVTHRSTDHRGIYQREGWGLIDTEARELCAPKYVAAHWIWGKSNSYFGNQCPKFYNELAPVALAEGYQRNGEKVWNLNSWGYINRQGQIVVWNEKPNPKPHQ